MSTKYFASLDIDSSSFEKELENSLSGNNYLFLLKWIRGKKIILLDCSVKVGDYTYDIIKKPVLDSDGTISLNLGALQNSNFKIQFRVYAVEPIPKMKAFVIDLTNQRKIKTTPTGNGTKKLIKKELWDAKM